MKQFLGSGVITTKKFKVQGIGFDLAVSKALNWLEVQDRVTTQYLITKHFKKTFWNFQKFQEYDELTYQIIFWKFKIEFMLLVSGDWVYG
jgi:hypothetical protein